MLDFMRRTDNLRYAIDWCIFGYPDNNNAPSTPCDSSCLSIQKTLKANMSQPSQNTAAYGYCQDGSFMAGVDLCSSCYALVDNHGYLSNCKSTAYAFTGRTSDAMI